MTTWTSGYTSQVEYIHGYFTETNPLFAKLAFATNGIAFPEVKNACELGFGQGLGLNIHASSSDTNWYGTDFNPSQASYAQCLAKGSENGAKCYDDSFSQFLERSDLPAFDFISLHGVWSWISNENRKCLVNFLSEKLSPGGIVYMGYNTLPGWSNFQPIRDLLLERMDGACKVSNDYLERINLSLCFVEDLLRLSPAFTENNPSMKDKVKEFRESNISYLAHEIFNKDWHPQLFSDVARQLESAKLTFASSAEYFESIDYLNLTEDQRVFLGSLKDPLLLESAKDFISNRSFRRDYWIKGKRVLSASEQLRTILNLRVALITNINDVSLEFSYLGKDIKLNKDIYLPILERLEDCESCKIADLEASLAVRDITVPDIVQAIQILVSRRSVHLAHEDIVVEKLITKTTALNEVLLKQTADNLDTGKVLASPLTGGGIPVDRFQQLFLFAKSTGRTSIQDIALFVWSLLEQCGEKILVDGKHVESRDENIAKLVEEAKKFFDQREPTLKKLKVI